MSKSCDAVPPTRLLLPEKSGGLRQWRNHLARLLAELLDDGPERDMAGTGSCPQHAVTILQGRRVDDGRVGFEPLAQVRHPWPSPAIRNRVEVEPARHADEQGVRERRPFPEQKRALADHLFQSIVAVDHSFPPEIPQHRLRRRVQAAISIAAQSGANAPVKSVLMKAIS